MFFGAEAAVSYGWLNFAAEVKDVAGGEFRINANEYRVSSSTLYGGSGPTAAKITKTGLYVPQLLGFGSSRSETKTKNPDGTISTTEGFNIGIAIFGIQINYDDQGVKDVRYGVDVGAALAIFVGAEVGLQAGGIYKFR